MQGRFEILCLSGSYLPSNTGGTRGRTGGLSVSLSGADGRVLGGGVGGRLTAATPVQVTYITLFLLLQSSRITHLVLSFSASDPSF